MPGELAAATTHAVGAEASAASRSLSVIHGVVAGAASSAEDQRNASHAKYEHSHTVGPHDQFHTVVAVYFFVLAGVLSLHSGALTIRRHMCIQKHDHPNEGFLVASSWPREVRHLVSLTMITLVLVPFVSGISALVFGVAYSVAEGWPFVVSFDYSISSIAALSNPLTNVTPSTVMGDFLDIFISLFQYIMTASVTGLVSLLAIVRRVSDGVPDTWCAVLRYAIIYMPLLISLDIFIFGWVLSQLEGWALRTGILYMASSTLGIPNPLTSAVVYTDLGKLVDVTAMIAQISFQGAFIGVMVGHQKVEGLVDSLEGTVSAREGRSETSGSADENELADTA